MWLLLLSSLHGSCRARDTAWAGWDARGMGRRGLTFCERAPQLHAQRVCATGPTQNRGHRQVCTLYLPRIHPVSSLSGAGQEDDRAAGMLQGAEGRSPQSPPASIPHAVAQASAPAACKGGQRAERRPASPPPRLLVLPALLPYTTQPPLPSAALAPLPSFPSPPEPLRRPGQGFGSLPGTHPSLHRAPREEA